MKRPPGGHGLVCWMAARAGAVVFLLTGILAPMPADATNRAVRAVGRSPVLPALRFFDATHATIVSNPATAKVSLFLTNARTDDFTVLVRNQGSYQVAASALATHGRDVEVSVPANIPYILKPKAPVRAVLSTTPVALGGVAGMNNAPSNRIELRLIKDWRRFDALSGSYTSVIEVCFLPRTDETRRYLPLTVKLFPSDGVALTEHTLVLTNSGFESCRGTSAICQSRDDNQIRAESDIGDAILDIKFTAEPFLYRILPKPVFWTTLICSLVGAIIRVARSGRKQLTPVKIAIELLTSPVVGFTVVAALWSGIEVASFSVAALAKLSGVAVVALLAGYGGVAILDSILKKWFPPGAGNPP